MTYAQLESTENMEIPDGVHLGQPIVLTTQLDEALGSANSFWRSKNETAMREWGIEGSDAWQYDIDSELLVLHFRLDLYRRRFSFSGHIPH